MGIKANLFRISIVNHIQSIAKLHTRMQPLSVLHCILSSTFSFKSEVGMKKETFYNKVKVYEARK